jgi:hypothetical protein
VQAGGVLVTDGDSQGICSVGGLWGLGQPEEQLNHALDLILLGLPETRHGFLDLQGRVLVNLDPRLGQDEQRDTSRLPQSEGALDVPGEKHRLDGGAVGAEIRHQGAEVAVNAEQALSEGEICRGRNGAETHRVQAVFPFLDDAVACGRGPGVDA